MQNFPYIYIKHTSPNLKPNQAMKRTILALVLTLVLMPAYARTDNNPMQQTDNSQIPPANVAGVTSTTVQPYEGSADAVRPKRQKHVTGANFQTYVYLGGLINQHKAGGPMLEASIGARCGECFFIGFHTGAHAIFTREGEGSSCAIPFAADMRVYIPTGRKPIFPYINISAGGVADISGFCGLLALGGIGIDINRISVGAGCSFYFIPFAGGYINGFLRIGYRFGKWKQR